MTLVMPMFGYAPNAVLFPKYFFLLEFLVPRIGMYVLVLLTAKANLPL